MSAISGSHECSRSSSMFHDDLNQVFCLVCTIASRLNCIPFDYNCRTQRLSLVKAKWRKLIWHGYVFVLFWYARFLLLRLVQMVAQYVSTRGDVIITISHVILLLFFLAFLTPTVFQLNIWIKEHEIVNAFNQVASISRAHRRQWSTATVAVITHFDRLKIIILPTSCYIGALVMLCVFIVRPEGDQFLFSIIPSRYQTWWAFSLFLLMETFAAVSVATTVMFQHVIQVVMMKSCSDILLQNCAQTPIDVREFSRMLRAYEVQQIVTTQFNRCFSFNMHLFKVVTVVIAVASNYMLIRVRKYMDVFSFIFVMVCALVFPPLPVLLYDQAFRVHDYANMFKSGMEIGLRLYFTGAEVVHNLGVEEDLHYASILSVIENNFFRNHGKGHNNK